MKKCVGLAVVGLGSAVAAFLFLKHDLRGWTPPDPGNPAAVVEPARPGDAAFTIGECLPGSVNPWNAPTAEEYSGSATVTVLTCRSRSSAIAIMLACGGAAIAVLVILLALRRFHQARAHRWRESPSNANLGAVREDDDQ
jgi:hypothetical protein